MKALLIFVLFFALLAVGAGCSSNKSESSDKNSQSATPASDAGGQKDASADAGKSADDSGQQVSIRFTWWGDSKRHEKYNAIADLFEKAHPNIKVVREFGSWNDYWDKLATQTAGGNAPDVVGMHAIYEANYAQKGALLDLGPYVQSGVIDLSEFPHSVIDVGQLDGNQLMVAQGVTMTGYFYNSALFDKLKVAPPDFNWTWDDFITKCKELRAANPSKNFWPSGDMSDSLTDLQFFVRQHGEEVFNTDGKLGVSKQTLIDWFNLWAGLRKDNLIPDAATKAQYANVSLEQSQFIKGQVAFAAAPFNQVPNYQNFTKEGDVVPIRRPTDPNGKVGEFVEGAYLSITSTSKHPKEAAEFINFFVNNEDAVKIFKMEQGALGNAKLNDVIKPLLNPAEQRGMGAIQETLKIAGKIPLPPAGQGEVTQALKDAAEKIAFDKSSVEQAVDEFMTKANGILNK